jgi:hypothetical protein
MVGAPSADAQRKCREPGQTCQSNSQCCAGFCDNQTDLQVHRVPDQYCLHRERGYGQRQNVFVRVSGGQSAQRREVRVPGADLYRTGGI